jgi:hypothetical protein
VSSQLRCFFYATQNGQILGEIMTLFINNTLSYFLECSKTDVYREGRHVLIYKTDNSTCPVNMLSRYCVLANIAPDSTYYLFRPLSLCKSTNTNKLHQRKLSYSTARKNLLSALETLGLNKKNIGLHSLRSGGSSAAAAAGVEDRLLKKTWTMEI